MRESKAIVFSDLELRKLGITRCNFVMMYIDADMSLIKV